ncbi:MAG TPA: ABC transporter substrate-binding protein, partial [Candidatus Binatia bacterium]|nr:ABC transporter substrate-binding protein [Candidatus Binatia bacterium]
MKLIFGLVLILFSAVASWGAQTAKLQLALNWKAEPEFGGFYTAKLSGYFHKRNLDVAITEGGAGTPVVQMVANSKVRFGIAAADEIVISQARGTDVVALFAVYQVNPQGIMVHPERGF